MFLLFVPVVYSLLRRGHVAIACEDDRNTARGLNASRERLLVARPVGLHDVRTELHTEADVPAQILEAVLLLQRFDRRVGGGELGLGDERHAERSAFAPDRGQDVHHGGLGVPAERGEEHDRIGAEDQGLFDVGDLHDLGTVPARSRARRQQQRERRGRTERFLGDADHPLAHHDDVRTAGDRLSGARADVRQRLEERRRGHTVVQGTDHRHAVGVDDPLEPHPLADVRRHDALLPGPRRTTVNSNASAKWCSSESSTGSPF